MTTVRKNFIPHAQYQAHRAKMEMLIEMQPSGMTSFEFFRGGDETGVSGTGKVLEGIVYSDGSVGIHWTVDLWSVTFFQDWATFVKIHIGSHPNNDGRIVFYPASREMPAWEWKQ